MNEPDDLEAQLPPLVGRVRASLRGEQVIFTFADGQELTYNREEADFIYTTLYQHRHHLAGASASIIPTPDVQYLALSGEAEPCSCSPSCANCASSSVCQSRQISLICMNNKTPRR